MFSWTLALCFLRSRGGLVKTLPLANDSLVLMFQTHSEDETITLGKTLARVLREYGGSGFGVFKEALSALVVDKLRPIAGEMRRLLDDPASVDAVLRNGAVRAAAIADPIVAEAERLVGLLRM